MNEKFESTEHAKVSNKYFNPRKDFKWFQNIFQEDIKLDNSQYLKSKITLEYMKHLGKKLHLKSKYKQNENEILKVIYKALKTSKIAMSKPTWECTT